MILYIQAPRIAVALLTAACCFHPAAASEEAEREQFFTQKVLPLLKAHCYECHSHEADSSEGGLVLDSRRGWKTGGDSGPAIVEGDPNASLLIDALSYRDDDLRMPPDGRMKDDEIAVFRRWVEDGAFDPRQTAKPLREKSDTLADDLWSLNPLSVDDDQIDSIDHFIEHRLSEADLKPNAAADRATLLRRASFGLTGLPPTPSEVERFLGDSSPDAWGLLINRLLDSPRYGERWGRHWLDLARYGDSNGGDINYAHANAWRYRDYVIQSLNDDKPYDEFIREQLAGDLLANGVAPLRRAELLTATGFLMLGPKMLAEVDGDKLLIDIVDEQLDVAGKTFLGMTFGCARCHDHKFDPITAEDYYALAGIFRSTRVMDSLRPEKVVGEWIEVDVTTPDVRKQIDALSAEKKRLEAELAAFGQGGKETKDPNAAGRAIVAGDLPTLRSTTWAARVRIESPQNLGCVISADYEGASQGHSLGFDRANNGQVPRVVWNHSRRTTIITAANPVSLGQWHHLAVTYSADTERLALYVDGEPAAEAEGVASTPFSTVAVGRREAPKEFQLLGDVDDVVVYDTALSQEDIVLLEAGQKLEQRPLFVWDFESVTAKAVTAIEGKHSGRLVAIDPQSSVIDDGFRGKAISLSVGSVLSEADKKRLVEIRARMKVVDKEMPESVRVMAVKADKPVDLPIHIRGSHTNLASESLPRTTPAVFNANLPAARIEEQANGRLQLAEWITHPENPLTARVMVNRIWQQHFGSGLVRTPSNFGARGERPSHPKLLDWLAHQFIKNNWSIKHMHRLIMKSEAYRRSSDLHVKADAEDADNRLLARFPVRRLEAEAIRDSLLSVSGELQVSSPGNLMQSPNMKRVAMTPNDSVYQSLHRGVYLPVIRVRGYEMFSIFDVSDNGQHVASRSQTMVAQQALFLMNNPFVIQRAKRVATRVLARDKSDAENIDWLHRLTLGRSASPDEAKLLGTSFQRLRMSHDPDAAWQAIAHSLFCSNEFIHVK